MRPQIEVISGFIRGSRVVNTMIGLEEEQDEEDFDSRVPPDFHTKKWPFPKLINNRPQGKDAALVWFMNEKRTDIARHIDVNRVTNKFRLVTILSISRLQNFWSEIDNVIQIRQGESQGQIQVSSMLQSVDI